jgi:hypothetical protein
MLTDPFVVMFLFFPVAAVAASNVGSLLSIRWFVMPLVTLVTCVVLTITVFGEPFAIWAFAYTVLPVVATVFAGAVRRSTATR